MTLTEKPGSGGPLAPKTPPVVTADPKIVGIVVKGGKKPGTK
jgi:hypothetical protein